MEDRQKREGKKRNHNNQTNKKLNVKKNGKKTNKLKSNVNKMENNKKAGFKYHYFGACEERKEGSMGENWGQKYVQNQLLKERVVVDWLVGGLGGGGGWGLSLVSPLLFIASALFSCRRALAVQHLSRSTLATHQNFHLDSNLSTAKLLLSLYFRFYRCGFFFVCFFVSFLSFS